MFSNSIFKKFNKGIDNLIKLFELVFESIKLCSISKIMHYNYRNLKKFMSNVNLYVKNNYNRFLDTIGGPGIVVEIDETKFGRRKYNRGHVVEGIWVLGMVERTADRRLVLIPVEKRDRNTLLALIKRHVAPGSIIHTDLWRGYTNLSKHFVHNTVNHSKWFVDEETGIHTNTIEGNWSYVKQNVYKKWRTKKNIWLPLAIVMAKRNGCLEEFLMNFL